MNIFLSCLVITFAVVVSAQLSRLTVPQRIVIQKAMVESKLIPDVVDTAGRSKLNIRFPSGVRANLGNKLTPTQVKDQPRITNLCPEGSYCTVLFIDADYSTNTSSQFLHGLWVNIPDSQLTEGEAIAEFISSGPLKCTGDHRYLFVSFEQSGKLQFDEKRIDNKTLEGRAGFNTREFAHKHSLGSPIAVNFYLAKYDRYVATLYKSLGAESMLYDE